MTVFIYIDESGTLPDPKDKVVVLAAVACTNKTALLKLLQKTKKLPRVNRSEEIKFYSAGNKTRYFYLNNLAKEDVSIFTLKINKGSQKIEDSPENYAVLSWLLLLDIGAYFKSSRLDVIFDKHFGKAVDETTFFKILRQLLDSKNKTTSADSKKEPGITAADMVAGACLYSQVGKDRQYYELIKRKVISEKSVNWKEAKKRFLQAIKNSPEPV